MGPETTHGAYVMSRHAQQRLQQRGIRPCWLELLLAHADRAIPVGGGATAFSVSRRTMHSVSSGGLRASEVERLGRLCAVVSEDGAVITTLKLSVPGQRFYRRYRRSNHGRRTRQ